MKTNVLTAAVFAGILTASFWAIGGDAPGAGPAPAVIPVPTGTSSAQEGYFMADGAVYSVRNGKAVRLNREVTMRITPAGILGFDGTAVILPAGQMIANDGHRVPLPAGLAPGGVKPVEPGATDPATLPPATVPVEPKANAPAHSREADRVPPTSGSGPAK